MKLSIVILAAGQGKRMRSDLPKVVQPLAGRPLLRHVIDTARLLDPAAIHVVYGHGGEQVRAQRLQRRAELEVDILDAQREQQQTHAGRVERDRRAVAARALGRMWMPRMGGDMGR